jgi:glycosyltransferase involved in cell wall biosynthesis
MNSLVLTHYRPFPPSGGAQLRNWQNVRALSLLGPVDVVSIGVDGPAERVNEIRDWSPLSLQQRSWWDRIKTRCWVLRPGVFPGVDIYHAGSIAQWLGRRVKERRYDVAVIEGISVASYINQLKESGCRVVFDAHNAESTLSRVLMATRAGSRPSPVRRVKDRILHRRMAAAERHVVMDADIVWACSDLDAEALARLCGRRRAITVVPNGVDVDSHHPGAAPLGADWDREPITLIYPGLFSYFPNEDAALRLVRGVLPILRKGGHAARVVLVGRNPTPRLLEEARRDSAVEVTGAVENVLSYLEQACVVTLPIALGSGTRLKVLEAFAFGRPVVSTAKGVEGIEALDEQHLLIREEPHAIASAVVDLWRSPSLRTRLCANARDLVRARYSWSVAARKIASSLGIEQPEPPSHAAPPMEIPPAVSVR